MRSREDLQNYDDRRLMLSDVSKKNLSTNLLDSSHRVGKDSSTHNRRRKLVEDAGKSYYSHSAITVYNNTYSDKQDLEMGDFCGFSSNPCREDSNYAYLIIFILSILTIIQTYRIYGLTEVLSIGGNLIALNMTKDGLPSEDIVESNFQVNFNMATSNTTMAINSMSTTENGTMMPIKSSSAAVRMGNLNGVMVPINNEMPMNAVVTP